MKKPAFQERTVYAYNSDGTQHRAPIEAITTLEAKLKDARNDLEAVQADEVESGYEFDYTIERKYMEGVVSGLEIALDYLQNRED